MSTQQTPAQQLIGDTAPKLVELTDQVLFGDVWERPGLSPRDRSVITVSALVALYRLEQLPGHLRRALANGVTERELAEAITRRGEPGQGGAMTGTAWSPRELKEIAARDELRVAPRRTDGTLAKPRIVWAVRVGDDVYIRSVNGTKYSRYFGPVASITVGRARATTLRLIPQ